MTQMNERQQVRVFMTASAKDAVETICERYGMSQIQMASRLFEWFLEQDEVVQTSVLGLLPRGHEADIASLILSGLAKKTYPRVAAKRMVGQKSTKARMGSSKRSKPGEG